MSRSFTYRLEGDIKRYMNGQPDKEEAAGTVYNASLPFLKADEPDKEEAAGTVYNASLPFLKADECERVKGQLSDIVQNMKEERQQSRSRGLHM